jgi:cytochrome b561
MSSDEDLKKAEFFYELVTKAEETSTKANERNTTKVQIMLSVLSTVIPISTGIGYYILSNTFSIPFFLLFVFSLIFFIIATCRGVYLLESKWFRYVDVGLLMERYDKEPLSFIIYKIASTLHDANEKNIKTINASKTGLKQMVVLIIAGLVVLTVAFSILGLQMYYKGM